MNLCAFLASAYVILDLWLYSQYLSRVLSVIERSTDRQYSFHYFLSFGYSKIKNQGRVTFSVIICSYFRKERIKITNISANNEAMLLKLGRDVAPYEMYQVVHILMLLWQHVWFLSPASSK